MRQVSLPLCFEKRAVTQSSMFRGHQCLRNKGEFSIYRRWIEIPEWLVCIWDDLNGRGRPLRRETRGLSTALVDLLQGKLWVLSRDDGPETASVDRKGRDQQGDSPCCDGRLQLLSCCGPGYSVCRTVYTSQVGIEVHSCGRMAIGATLALPSGRWIICFRS